MLEAGVLAVIHPRESRLLITYHCDVTTAGRKSLLDTTAVSLVEASARICLSKAERIFVSSIDYGLGSKLIADHMSRCVELFPPDKAPEGLAPRMSQERGCKIGFLGRFVIEKGLNVLLKAMREVLRHRPDALLLLAGDNQHVPGGTEYEALKGLIEPLGKSVQVLGRVSEAELFDFYRSLDLFVLPSVNSYEAFGMVQVEAMKAGVPVLASDMRGVRVPILQTNNGETFPIGDADALARAILRYLECSPKSPIAIAESAWNHFSNQRFIEKLEEVYRSNG